MTNPYLNGPENKYFPRLGNRGLHFFPIEVLEDDGLESRVIVPEIRAIKVVENPDAEIKDYYLLNGSIVDADKKLDDLSKPKSLSNTPEVIYLRRKK